MLPNVPQNQRDTEDLDGSDPTHRLERMNKMKKLMTLILALAMVLSLAACGGGKTTLKILETEYAVEDYAICVAKENEELLGQLNEALAALKADGTAQKIVDKYISGVEHDLAFQQDAEGKEELIMATNANFPPL